MKKSFAIHAISLLSASVLFGATPQMIEPASAEWADSYQPPYKEPTELAVGSELRSELFGLLRKKAKAEHKFAGSLKAYRNWALFVGSTVDAKGNSVAYPPMDNSDSVALWLRTKDGWRLVDYSFGHSDAFYLVWAEQYGAPAELLGM